MKAVDEYVSSNALEVEVRFDVIGIVKVNNETKMEHLKDAFFHF